MNDAIGGTVNVVIIAVFLVLLAGFMAFNVSYVKAFKVKNKIIDLVEQYEGKCNPNDSSNACTKKIEEYMVQIGYNNAVGNKSTFCKKANSLSKVSLKSNNNCCNASKGFCIAEVRVQTKDSKVDTSQTKSYFRVLTQVKLDIPVINKLMEYFEAFEVTGETKTIVIK